MRVRTWRNHRVWRKVAVTMVFAMGAMEVVPPGVFASPPPPPDLNRMAGLKPGLEQALSPETLKKVEARQAAAGRVPDVRPLTPAEMKGLRGKGPYRNAYFCGALPWQRSIRDVNLSNGNLFKSFTDIQVSPARGAGLALQRTYNSQDPRIGPFGVGWTHAYDIRMEEAGGNNVPRTDFFGGKHTYHRDADGLYSPPVYLFDQVNSQYLNQLVNGPPTVESDTDTGMDGTIKHYFANGNERDCDSITDRHGNVTSLVYNQAAVMPDGSSRNLLTRVTGPSGRQLNFTWTNLGTAGQPAWRITQVQGPQYSVTYSYYTNPNEGNAANDLYNLQSVTLDPGGVNRTTSYTYTGVTGPNGSEYGLLSSITDPAGHSVSYTYTVLINDPTYGWVPPFTGTAWVTTVTEPAGPNYPQGLIWTISPAVTGNGGKYFNTLTSNGGINYVCIVDSSLRCVQSTIGNSNISYTTTYDSANNVTQTVQGESPSYSGVPDQSQYWQQYYGNFAPGVTDNYTFDPVRPESRLIDCLAHPEQRCSRARPDLLSHQQYHGRGSRQTERPQG